MAGRSLPVEEPQEFRDRGQAMLFGSAGNGLYVWPDDRGGINIQTAGGVSLVLRPRNGHSIRVHAAGDDTSEDHG